jgi:hypothetical protein
MKTQGPKTAMLQKSRDEEGFRFSTMVTLQKMFTFSLNGYTIAGVNTIKNKNF